MPNVRVGILLQRQQGADEHTRFKGFLQIYQLQTENDEEETWRDLVSAVAMSQSRGSDQTQSSHGFDRSLQLVYTRREEADDIEMIS